MTDNKYNFDDIRPFDDAEVNSVINSLCEVPYFQKVLGRLFPNYPTDAVIKKLKTVTSKDQFQAEFVIPYIKGLVENNTDGLTASGLENLDPKKGYVFMSNHRDIILDSAFLNFLLKDAGFKTTEIAIGSNLLIYEWITDLVKLNKSFVVKRDLPVRQMMQASTTLSAYIRDSITNRNQNIWIAEREGRSKDGNDLCQGSVLKMLNLSGENDLIDNFAELNIVPVSITYEYDPCDALKAFQYQEKRDIPDYKKQPDEDLTHMSKGLSGYKGRVHFSFGAPLNDKLASLSGQPKNAQIDALAAMVDKQVHGNYLLRPNNFIALDELNNNNANAANYTDVDKAKFDQYLEKKIADISGADHDFIREQMLQAYANPLINQQKALQ